jgi:hypothetical protein
MSSPEIGEGERRRLRAYFEGFDQKPCRYRASKYRLAWEQGRSDGIALREAFGDNLKPVPGLEDPSWTSMRRQS